MKKYRVVDLFAGVGGLSYGFYHRPEFEVVMANEMERDIAKAYVLNHPDVEMVNCDVATLTEEKIREATAGKRIDLVLGGPPCQSYSTVGKRQMDGRAGLFMEYKRILSIMQPQAFIFENVTGILSMEGGTLFQRIRAEFEELGYELKYRVLDAVDYGVPQHRERVILVGMKGSNVFEYPEATHGEGRKPHVSLRQAIGDLPRLKSGETGTFYEGPADNEFLAFARNADCLTEHVAPRNGAELIRIMEALKDGQSKNDLPEETRPKSGYGNTYAKLWWDRPSTTITRNFACPSSSRCIHPRDSRAMTIREGARLQSFPDSYHFYGSAGTKRLEIGNAVPPLLSVPLARQMLAALEQTDAGEQA